MSPIALLLASRAYYLGMSVASGKTKKIKSIYDAHMDELAFITSELLEDGVLSWDESCYIIEEWLKGRAFG